MELRSAAGQQRHLCLVLPAVPTQLCFPVEPHLIGRGTPPQSTPRTVHSMVVVGPAAAASLRAAEMQITIIQHIFY